MEEAGPVTLVLEDGNQVAAGLVIGADGSSSTIRQCLLELGKELGTTTSSEWAIASGIVKYTAEQTKTITRTKRNMRLQYWAGWVSFVRKYAVSFLFCLG